MKTVNVFDTGDVVMIKGTVYDVKVEGGVHKYQIKDKKSSDVLATWFTADELVPCNEESKDEK